MGFRRGLGQIALNSCHLFEIVENDQAAGVAAQPVPRDFELEPVFRLWRNPARLDGQVHELGVDILVGGQPDHAIGVVVAVAVGVFHRQLRFPQAAQPLKHGRLADCGAAPGGELLPHLVQRLFPPDDLIALLAIGDVERRITRVVLLRRLGRWRRSYSAAWSDDDVLRAAVALFDLKGRYITLQFPSAAWRGHRNARPDSQAQFAVLRLDLA